MRGRQRGERKRELEVNASCVFASGCCGEKKIPVAVAVLINKRLERPR